MTTVSLVSCGPCLGALQLMGLLATEEHLAARSVNGVIKMGYSYYSFFVEELWSFSLVLSYQQLAELVAGSQLKA